jgi:hypothetical protein
MAGDKRIATLNREIDELKREYDLYLAGLRKTEPIGQRAQLERKVVLLARTPVSSTVFKFQAKTLAHRFRALETQLKNLMDAREAKHKVSEQVQTKQPSAVIIDNTVINNPKLVVDRVRRMVTELNKKNLDQDDAMSLDPENFCNALVGKAKTMVGKGEVRAVRFQIVESDGEHKVKGEVIGAPK